MGFTLKKLLSAFLMPLSIVMLILAWGLWHLYRQSYTKAKIYLSVGFICLLLISSGSFSNSLLEPLEKEYKGVKDAQAKYILLLGGDFQARAYEAIKLHHENHDSIIITSGYPGLGKKVPEARINANHLIALGIKKENILMQEEPRDTIEEARHIKKIVKEEPFILVTSAYHMPRAMKVFRNEGLEPIPAPTNFMVRGDSSLLGRPSGSSIKKVEIAFHEYLGIAWNKLKSLLSF